MRNYLVLGTLGLAVLGFGLDEDMQYECNKLIDKIDREESGIEDGLIFISDCIKNPIMQSLAFSNSEEEVLSEDLSAEELKDSLILWKSKKEWAMRNVSSVVYSMYLDMVKKLEEKVNSL